MNPWTRFWTWYFEPCAWERAGAGRIYERLGIRAYKKYLPTSGDLVSRWSGTRRIGGPGREVRADLERWERRTRTYEGRHLFGGLSMLALTWWAIAVHGKGSWTVLLLANLLINGYPILLQRYNRVRVRHALARREQNRT